MGDKPKGRALVLFGDAAFAEDLNGFTNNGSSQ